MTKCREMIRLKKRNKTDCFEIHSLRVTTSQPERKIVYKLKSRSHLTERDIHVLLKEIITLYDDI